MVITEKVHNLEQQLEVTKKEVEKQKFRLQNIASDDGKVFFYTGFPSYKSLMACFEFLGPAAHQLVYSSRSNDTPRKVCRPRSLPPLEECFLVLVRLRPGLMEYDLADQFGVSQSTVSRITITWINFMYLQLKQIPLQPCREIIQSFMLPVFESVSNH